MKKYILVMLILGLALPSLGQLEPLEVVSQETVEEEVILPSATYSEEEVIPSFNVTYSWGDFLMGKTCTEDFEELQTNPFLTESQEILKNKFQKYCLGEITIWKTVLETFYQNKKALLIHECLQKNGRWLGYVKALPYFLFDIHMLNPTGNDLNARLDRIQNAIQSKDPTMVIELIQDLSPEQQLFLMPHFNMVKDLLDFKDLLKEDA